MEERILCAAIWYDDGKVRVHQPKNIGSGIVICGRRHHNCIAVLAELFPNREYINQVQQGFLTSTDRFVLRYDAGEIAIKANQVKSSFNGNLFSEDLY